MKNVMRFDSFFTSKNLIDIINSKGVDNIRFIDSKDGRLYKIVERHYKIEENYKIELTPIFEDRPVDYYLLDLASLIDRKCIFICE